MRDAACVLVRFIHGFWAAGAGQAAGWRAVSRASACRLLLAPSPSIMRPGPRISRPASGLENSMTDPLSKITEGKDLLGKIRNFLAGLVGYVDRENRREADKMLRENLARRTREQWTRIS